MFASKIIETFRNRLASGDFDYVSFDVFDTLICRPTKRPDDLYQIIGSRASQASGLGASDFAKVRRRAENEARVCAKAAGVEEVELGEIYERFCKILGLDASYAAGLVEIEEDSELACFYLSEMGKQLLTIAREHAKRVFFVSDTYYSIDFMNRALADLKQGGDTLLISSREKLTKHSGTLFKLLLDLGDPARILHVGDNIWSDVRNAIKNGINVFHVSNGNQMAHDLGYLLTGEKAGMAISIAQGVINRELVNRTEERSFQDRMRLLGYGALGPFWCGFCEVIRSTVEQEEIEKVYFLARDGFVLRHAYKAYCGGDAEYLSVSRHTLYLAYAHIDFEAAFPLLLQNYSDATIGTVLSRLLPEGTDLDGLGLPSWAYDALGEQVNSQKSYERLVRLFRILASEISKHAKHHFEMLSNYLRQQGVTDHRHIAIVDVGWHGSLQVLMQRILQGMNARVKITGLYVGLFEHAKQPVGRDVMMGYLFDHGSNKDLERMVKCGPSVIEVLHSAPHGTTIGYDKAETGEIEPRYAESEAEDIQYRMMVQYYQKGGIDFIKDFNAARMQLNAGADGCADTLMAANLLRLAERPTEEAASFISLLGLHPDFGPSDEIIRLAEARGNGNKSMWPIGRSMQFRSRLPAWFDEDRYLNSRADVLAAVQAGQFECGYHHYLEHGKDEQTK